MSKRRFLLAASLILNAILVAWAALPGAPSGKRSDAGVPTGDPPKSTLAAWFAKLAPSSDASSQTPVAAAPSDAGYSEAGWTRSLHDDVAELRERGFDDATVRMLALAEAERLFRERAQAVLAPKRRAEYWESRRQRLRVEPSQLATFQRLRREKLAAIEELVGPDAVSTERNTPETFTAAPLMTLGYLPVDKRLALSEYLETTELEFSASQSPVARLRRMPSNAAAYAEHEMASDAQIRVILGPQLYDEYLRRSSQTAHRLRSELTAFRPTRAEFDALVAIEHEQRTQKVQMGAFGRGMTPDKTGMVRDQYAASLRGALGEQRYADYERARDHSTVSLDYVVSELQVAPEAARASFEALERARTKWQALLLQAASQAPDARIQADLVAVQKQLRIELATTLGLEAMDENDLATLLAGVESFPYQMRQMR